MSDIVNHPDHYSGKVECIDAMLDIYGKEKVAIWCELNAFKYLWRSERKNGLEDIAKAAWYLNKELELRPAKPDEHICGSCRKWNQLGVMDDGVAYGLCYHYDIENTECCKACRYWKP